MIPPLKVAQVKELLAQGDLSHRKIARLTGVSRATIGAIANGKRPDYKPRSRNDKPDYLPIGPAARCPRCGNNVYQPCLECYVRDIKEAEEAVARAYRKRYRELRLRRLLARLRREQVSRLASDRLPKARAG